MKFKNFPTVFLIDDNQSPQLHPSGALFAAGKAQFDPISHFPPVSPPSHIRHPNQPIPPRQTCNFTTARGTYYNPNIPRPATCRQQSLWRRATKTSATSAIHLRALKPSVEEPQGLPHAMPAALRPTGIRKKKTPFRGPLNFLF